MRSSRPLLTFAASACLFSAVLAGCGGKRAGGFQMPPTPVEIAPVSAGGVTDRFRAVGTIEAEETVRIVNEVAGVVRELPFAEGRPVRRGELIAHMEDRELAAEAARADALADQARTSHSRIQQLFQQNAASQQELDDAASTLKVAEANALVAKTRLEKARILSPLTGVAGRRLVSPGTYLPIGTPITEVASVGHVKVGFSAPERYLSQLKRKAIVTVTSTAYPGEVFSGDLSVVDPLLNASTHTVQMVARIENTDGKLRPGMSADVTATLEERPDALTVPDEAVFSEGDQSFVYLVQADTVVRQPVVLGTRDSSHAEITRGLKAGDQVVRAGYQKLYPGAHVMPAGAPPPGGTPAAGPGGK